MTNIDSKDCVEELPCDLCDHELLEYAARLSNLHQQKLDIEAKKKAAVTEFGARTKKIDGEISLLSNNISTKKETRNVECRADYHWPKGKRFLIRLDTGELVSESVISEFERQQHMEFMNKERTPSSTEESEEESPAIEVEASIVHEETPEDEKPETEPGTETEEAEAEVEEPVVEEEVFQETDEPDPELGEASGPVEAPEPIKSGRKVTEYACKACGNMFNDPRQIDAGEDEPPLEVCPNCESPNFS